MIVALLCVPAASRAVTVILLLPFRSVIPEVVQAAVPVAVPWAWSEDQVTWVVLSGAVPPKVIEFCEVLKVEAEVGDVITTGTPKGVGGRMDPPQFLADGDQVTVEIEQIGALTSRIVAA